MATSNFADPQVEAVFAGYPEDIRRALLSLRELVFAVAEATGGVGQLQETLKWGQPSYLTAQTKSGSTIRIDQVKGQEGRFAAYFHCQSGLVPTFKELYGDELSFEGNRAILFHTGSPLPVAELQHCLALALTHHLRKRAKAKQLA